MVKIYTKGGDKGQTSLFDGTRVSKASELVSAYGTVDELNTVLGLARAFHTAQDKLGEMLSQLQYDLLNLGATLASGKPDSPRVGEADILRMEGWIDELTAEMPVLRNFILPTGHPAAAHLHQARTVCRRAERLCVAIAGEGQFDYVVVRFLNRLSDLLFVLARFANHVHGVDDTVWKSEQT